MKRFVAMVLCLLMLLCSASALAEGEMTQSVVLDSTTIIEGDLIYYSGSVDGGENGVYVMNSDGSDVRKLVDATNKYYALMGVSGGNLMAFMDDYSSNEVVSQVVIIRQDGTVQPVPEAGSSYDAVVADGRFYWGTGSCAVDGSDAQVYFQGESYQYHPLAVADGYYYYLDWTEMGGSVFSEGSDQPIGAALCRMNLTDGSTEMLSGLGTACIGLENDQIYYTRTNFWTYAEGSDPTEVEVDQGLFKMDLSTRTETRLASYKEAADEMYAVESYALMDDGVIYGLYGEFPENGEGEFKILRVSTSGEMLPAIEVDADSWALSEVKDGTIYITCYNGVYMDDDYIQKDQIVALSQSTGEQRALNPDSTEVLFFSESDPAIALAGDRIYYTAYDMENWSVSLKSMKLDGSDLITLAHGISYAEG